MDQDTQNPESHDSHKTNGTQDSDKDLAAKRLSNEGWTGAKAADTSAKDAAAGADKVKDGSPTIGQRIEQGKPFAGKDDVSLRNTLNDWMNSNSKDGASNTGGLRRFASFAEQINGMIKDKNTLASGTKLDELDKARITRVLDVVEKYQANQDALSDALKKNNAPELKRLLKDEEALKKQMETKEFKQDLDKASQDLTRGFNVLRQNLGTTYDGLLTTLVDFGRKIPLEQLPVDLPVGLKGFAISNEQFRSLVSQGQLKMPERTLADNQLPSGNDLREINKILRFSDAAQQEIHRGTLEQQFALAQSKLNQIDPSGELVKKWFPEKVEKLSDDQIEKRLAAATPWIQKGQEVQRYAELHHRLNKMISDQFNWPKFLGGIPSKWDNSAIENNPDVVKVSKDDKTQKINIAVKLPETLDRNDANTDQMRLMDEWLAKYKGPVDQVLGQIDASKAENSVVYWGDIKAEMRVDKDGNIVEKGWLDAKGRQIFQESDGRKYRFNDDAAKEWVPVDEKLTQADYRVINGKTDWVKPGEEIKDVNLMEFRTDAKAVKGPNGEPLIEIKQKQNLQYAHWASYNGWGWVSDVKTMGGDINAQKLDSDTTIAADKGVAGGRRDGKKGDYLVTLADGRQQVIDSKSFEQLYRQREGGKPGEFEEKPRTYKPDDWLVVYRTDSGMPQPTLMQAKDVPSFVSSQFNWHWGNKVVSTGVDALMLLGGVAEVRAAMVGVEAAAGTAAKMTTMQVLGKALLTRQGMTGLLHAGFGATGFMGQGIENLGPYGKGFMQARAIAMMLDLGYTAIGRPYGAKPFVPSAEQIAQQGFFSRGLLKFSQVFSGESTVGRVQSLGADLFFLSDIGVRQIPGIVNRTRGTDSQAVQQQAALERRWPQSTLLEDKKAPSSFDKQTMLHVEAFKKPTEDALKLPDNDPKRTELNKKLIETVQNEKADARDRLGAAFALVTLNSKDGKLPEKIDAAGASITRDGVQKFVDSQRYLQAKEVVDGYVQGLKIHVSADVQGKLNQLEEKAKLSMKDDDAIARTAALAELVAAFKSSTASPEEKLVAASALLFARRSGADSKLSDTIEANGNQVQAKDLVDFLSLNAQARQGSGSSATSNPGHMRLFAGDMLLRLDIDRFSLEDMNQICLSIVNDKAVPADAAAKERMTQLKLQAMTDSHGYRLGDLYELMKSRVEPAIAAMPSSNQKEMEAKGQALASLLGRDSEAIKTTLETLRTNPDARIAGLASYMLFAADSDRPADRIDNLAQLHKDGSPFAWPQGSDLAAQSRWVNDTTAAMVAKLNADLPGQAGNEFDRVSGEKLRAAQALMAKFGDLKANPEVQAQINSGLMALVTGDNPVAAAQALPLLLNRIKGYEDIFKQIKPEELTAPLKDLRDKLFSDGAILDTLRGNSIDMLKDSATYSTYASRMDNLSRDLQKLSTDFVAKRDKASETERSEMEAKIADLTQALNTASTAPGELKKALLQGLPVMLQLGQGNPLAAAKDVDMRSILNAVQDLCQVKADRPETASPDLRTQAIKTLSELGNRGTAVSSVLARALSDDPSPQVRLAALDSLKKLAPDDLQKICLQQLATEKHPEVARRLREIEFSNRRPDPDSCEYQEKFTKAKIDLVNQAARSLSGAESYLKSNDDLKFLDGQTLRKQALSDLQDQYFNGVGGFFRFAWNGESGVDTYHAQMLDKYAGYMRKSMDTLGQKAATDDEALKALVYVALSNGRPLLKDDRQWATDKATEKLKEICQNCSADRARNVAWAVENLLLHQPAMTATGRQNVLDGLKALIAKPGQAGLSNSQVATLLASAMQRELRNTPPVGAPDFAGREKLQLDMLNLLSDQRFRTREILPVLEAISNGTPKYKIIREGNGDVSKVQYPDGSTREMQARGGAQSKYIFKDASGKETVWLPDSKPNRWYKETDKDKKEPWTGVGIFDKASGDYVRVNSQGDQRTVIKPNGAQVDMVNNNISKITYPDGSSREFDPPGACFKRQTVSSADGKTKDIWERDGNSNTFYKQGDSAKKTPWTGQELADAASGDYVSVQGNTRTITRTDGSKTQIKDGVVSELQAPAGIAYNSSIVSVRQKAQELFASLSDRSDLLRQQAQLPEGADAAKVAQKISDEIANSNASSEKVGRAIAISEKLGAISSDNDPRRAPLQIAARDGHELVRMMAARELAKSSNAHDRKLAYSVLARLEAQGSRPGYVSESHELIAQILTDTKVSADDKASLASLRIDAAGKLDAASYRSKTDRTADISANLDYQDNFERASRELKENALRNHSLAKYQGSDNWFSKNENYKLLDDDKLREAQGQAAKEAFPGFIPWIFTSRSTIDKRCDDAVKEVWNKQDREMTALGEQAKLDGDAGKEAREGLASIIMSQGQPLRESDRAWAMHEAARMIRDCIKDGHPGSRDMMWAVQAALIEEPSLDPMTRWYLMSAVENAQKRGIIDTKEASLVMASALESEYQGMPSQGKDPAGYKSSLTNQSYAISMLMIWENAEASPVLQALGTYHPDPPTRQRAKQAFEFLNLKLSRPRADAGTMSTEQRVDAGTASDGDKSANASTANGVKEIAAAKKTDEEEQIALNQLQDQILEFERIRLRLPQDSSSEQIQKALINEGSRAA